MPSLQLLGQKTPFAGDDLRFFSAIESLERLLQLALAIVLIIFTTRQKNLKDELNLTLHECEEDGNFSPMATYGLVILYLYDALALVLSIVGLAAAIPTFLISGKGTPTDSEPRRALYPICCFNLSVVNTFRILGFCFGILSIVVLQEYCGCLSSLGVDSVNDFKNVCPEVGAWIGVMIGLVVTHGIDAMAAIVAIAYFSCHLAVPSNSLVSAESKWKLSLACCFGCSSILTCCIFGGREAILGDFGDFATVMSNYFNNNKLLDVTASDVVAGLLMVLRVQQLELLETKHRLLLAKVNEDISDNKESKPNRASSASKLDVHDQEGVGHSSKEMAQLRSMSHPHLSTVSDRSTNEGSQEIKKRELLSPQHPRELYLTAEAARYMPMAQATYGWISYLLENPSRGLCGLGFRILRRCACLRWSKRETISGDYICQPHTVALKAISGLHEEDIFYASFQQSIKKTPYMIALDHEWKTVVLAIRGTLSLESLLADLTLRPEEMTNLGEECGFDGKGRFCHAGILDCAEWIYRDLLRHGKLKQLLEKDYSNYRLRIVGHSLGAGIAAILSVLFRPKYTNLRCLAFSPPGCVCSNNLADECSTWLTSYILDADIVPRLSIESFEALRNSVLDMICRIKVPKHQVIYNWQKGIKDRDELAEGNAKFLYEEDKIKDSDFKKQLEKFYRFQATLKEENEAKYIQLCPPGRIIQLFRTASATSLRHFLQKIFSQRDVLETQEYTARWVERGDLQKVVICSHLLSNHDPINVKTELMHLASHFGLEPPYSNVLRDDEV